jgi:thiol-disulfide isomerase/thioredoxin
MRSGASALAATLLLLLAACDQRERSAPASTAARPKHEALHYEEALAQAQLQRLPLIVDFHAPWCYSCYYMASHVLNGPEWEAVRKRALVVEVDADAPAGAALRERYAVKALPSYLVLDPSGDELGRILGEQTRVDFYARLNQLLDHGTTLDSLAAAVRDDGEASLRAARELLRAWHARHDPAAALAWLDTLEAGIGSAVRQDAQASAWLARLRFMDAAQREDRDACLAVGEQVLAGSLGCERAYELRRYLGCAAQDAQHRRRLAAQHPALQSAVESGVFGDARCADERSLVLVAADLQAALADRDAETALLRRAIADLEMRLDGALASDRNLADNLRVYVERLAAATGDHAAYDALMPRLIEAWPQDYVYAFRLGRSLLVRERAADALPYLEQAAEHAYGINRLQVAEQRVKALLALDRHEDARRVVGETLRANGPWFPEQAAALKQLLKT